MGQSLSSKRRVGEPYPCGISVEMVAIQVQHLHNIGLNLLSSWNAVSFHLLLSLHLTLHSILPFSHLFRKGVRTYWEWNMMLLSRILSGSPEFLIKMHILYCSSLRDWPVVLCRFSSPFFRSVEAYKSRLMAAVATRRAPLVSSFSADVAAARGQFNTFETAWRHHLKNHLRLPIRGKLQNWQFIHVTESNWNFQQFSNGLQVVF